MVMDNIMMKVPTGLFMSKRLLNLTSYIFLYLRLLI